MTPIQPSSVAVALSGGVDSSLAAALLKEQGWEVHGLHFLLTAAHPDQEGKRRAVERLARHLGISLRTVDVREDFERRVVEPFLEGYLCGLTPSPCVSCNPGVKFRTLVRWADEQGIAFVATGHYARVGANGPNGWALYRGKAREKEQSYFLHRLGQPVLARCLFPLGGMHKQETRRLAADRRLPAWGEPESQEICFIPEGDYRAFLISRKGPAAARPGDIVEASGKKVGVHQGAFRYTIGQRRGLGIASSRPYYVVALRPDRNEVVVGRRGDLFRSHAEARDVIWTSGAPAFKSLRAEAQVRYRHEPAPGRVHMLAPDRVRFDFDEPQPAVTPGQALVCYEGDRVLGGGWIE